MKAITILVFLSTLVASGAQGEQSSQSIFQLLEGTWQSNGPAFGQTAHSTMQWQPTLDGRYFRVNYDIAFGAEDAPTSSFTGVGYYRMDSDAETINGFWADNTGDLHPIEASVSADRILSTWGEQGKKLGQTEYRVLDGGDVEVTDWIWRDGEFRQFNQNSFKKADE